MTNENSRKARVFYSRYAEERAVTEIDERTYALRVPKRDVICEEPRGNVMDLMSAVSCAGGPECRVGRAFEYDQRKRRITELRHDYYGSTDEHSRYLVCVEVSNGRYAEGINNKKNTRNGKY